MLKKVRFAWKIAARLHVISKAPLQLIAPRKQSKKGQKIMGRREVFGTGVSNYYGEVAIYLDEDAGQYYLGLENWDATDYKPISSTLAAAMMEELGDSPGKSDLSAFTRLVGTSVDDNKKTIVDLGEGQKAIRDYLEGLEKRLDGLERIVLENAGIAQVEAD